MKIATEYWAKPIPDRRFDWIAVDDDTYDGAPDSHCPVGTGATEQQAIDDLLEQLEDSGLIGAEDVREYRVANGPFGAGA